MILATISRFHLQVYHDLKLTDTRSAESSDNICHLCICPTSGDIIYVCEDGDVYLINLDTMAVRRILNLPCIRVCKIKMFSCKKELLLVVLVERNTNLFVLHVSTVFAASILSYLLIFAHFLFVFFFPSTRRVGEDLWVLLTFLMRIKLSTKSDWGTRFTIILLISIMVPCMLFKTIMW